MPGLADQGKCEDAMALVNQSPVQDARFDEIIKRCSIK